MRVNLAHAVEIWQIYNLFIYRISTRLSAGSTRMSPWSSTPCRCSRRSSTEQSFSRAAEKLFRTQPAVSLAVQRLEAELGEKLIDRDMRGAKELVLTDAGRVVFEHARRFHNLEAELDVGAGRAARQLGGPADDRRQRIVDAVSAAAHRALPRAVSRRSRCRSGAASRARSRRAGRGRPRARRHQLRSRRRAAGDEGHLHRRAGVHRLAEAPAGEAAQRLDRRARQGDVHRPQRAVAVPRRRAARVPAPQGAAEHGRRDADAGDDPPAGAERRGRRLPAAHVRAPGRRDRRRPRGARSRSCTSSARSGCSTRRRARSAMPRKRSSTWSPTLDRATPESRFKHGGMSCSGR